MQSVSAQVDRIQLQKHQTHLTRDIELLDTLYDKTNNTLMTYHCISLLHSKKVAIRK